MDVPEIPCVFACVRNPLRLCFRTPIFPTKFASVHKLIYARFAHCPSRINLVMTGRNHCSIGRFDRKIVTACHSRILHFHSVPQAVANGLARVRRIVNVCFNQFDLASCLNCTRSTILSRNTRIKSWSGAMATSIIIRRICIFAKRHVVTKFARPKISSTAPSDNGLHCRLC